MSDFYIIDKHCNSCCNCLLCDYSKYSGLSFVCTFDHVVFPSYCPDFNVSDFQFLLN